MSSPRLLLVSGAPGAGTSTVASALADAATVRGEMARLIDDASLTSARSLPDVFGRVDPLLGEALDGLPALRTVRGLLAAMRAVDDAPDATVVWDAGPIESLLADLATLDSLDAVAGQVGGSAIAIAASLAGERLLALRAVQAEVTRGLRMLREDTVALVLVDEPGPRLRRRARTARAQASLLGLSIDLLVVNRVPRARDGWPRTWASDRRRRAAAVAELGIASHQLRWFLDDADASRLVRRVARRLPSPVPSSGAGHVVAEALAVEPVGEGYVLRIPMPHADPATVRAGRLGGVLVVEVAGLRRMLALPPVLTRCTVDGGGVVGDDLVLRFTPDPAQWRSAS